MIRRLRLRARRLVKPLMIGLLVVILLLLIPAAFGPSCTTRRIIFAVVLYAAIILLLLAIFVGWAYIERVNAELRALKIVVTKHVGVCQALQIDHELDDRFNTIVTHIQRTAS